MPATQESVAPTEVNDDLVRNYLKANGDFLQRHPDLLDHLYISHASGSAISLVEKQVSILRERNIDMRHRLKSLTSNARDNDRLHGQTCALVLKLLEAESVGALYHTFMASMRDDFGVEHASMILFGNAGEGGDAGQCRLEPPESALGEVGALLRGRKAVCGVLRREELTYLFPGARAVGSAALAPLGDEGEFGVIAVGSADTNRYNGATGTLFLEHIAQVMARLLPRLWCRGE
jgi:uncharacterized protein YigA (DUF484 family)